MTTSPHLLRLRCLGNRLQVTVKARQAIAELSQEEGRQHVVVTWPAGAVLLPAHIHQPAPHEAIVGHLAECPIFIDLRQVAMWPDRSMVLDVTRAERRWRGARPCFVLTDADSAMRQRMTTSRSVVRIGSSTSPSVPAV